MSKKIQLYTDGSSRGNPGKGGYGLILMYGKHRKEMSAAFRKTTNNRMELLAVIEGLSAITDDTLPVVVYTDSKYVSDAINKNWLEGWHKRGYTKIKNPDLWRRFYPLWKKHSVEFVWVKGHADNVYNNRCDELATLAADQGPYAVDSYYEESVC